MFSYRFYPDLSLSLSIDLFICLSIYLSMYLFSCLSLFLHHSFTLFLPSEYINSTFLRPSYFFHLSTSCSLSLSTCLVFLSFTCLFSTFPLFFSIHFCLSLSLVRFFLFSPISFSFTSQGFRNVLFSISFKG